MNSWTVLTGIAFDTTSMLVSCMMLATGTVSRMKSNGQVLVERGADRVVGRHEQQRIAVGRRVDRRRGGDIAAGAGAVFHHELLAEMFRQPLAHDARHDIDRAACRKADQPVHRAVRIIGGGCRRDTAGKARKADHAEHSRAQDSIMKPLPTRFACDLLCLQLALPERVSGMLSHKPAIAYIAFCLMF